MEALLCMKANIRTRYAPSPTGPLHIGGAHTALFNYLFARKHGGKFIVRIEDTDLERSDKKYEKEIFEGLAWLGIDADESPEKGGPHKPYRQSERTVLYKKYIEKLLADGRAFYCFHSEKELDEEKTKLLEAKRPPLHLCEYKTMNPKEAEILTETKKDYIIRFKTPADKKITFQDLIRGEVSFESALLGDFSIAKSTDVPLYNFAVVVDDEEMKITHVIRGEDHISNTPKQLLIIEALGFKIPKYTHLPLILGPDRSKLSKRHGAISITEYKKYHPAAVFNFMALLGWNPGNNKELFSRDELIREFSLDRVQKSGAILDIKKLEWMHMEYVRKERPEDIAEYLAKNVPQFVVVDINTTAKAITLEASRLTDFSLIGESAVYGVTPYDAKMLIWKNMNKEEIKKSLERSIEILKSVKNKNPAREDLEKVFFAAIGEGDKGRILWPLRVALTGKKASPGPFEILEILGIEEALKRIMSAKEILLD